MYKLFLIFFIVLISCKKETNNSELKDNLYNELIKYQKENAIDKKAEKFLGKNHFIYQVMILPPQYANSADKNFSLYITVSTFGIGKEIKKNYYGIFEDELLQKTVIYDEANFIDKFSNKKKKENLDNFIVKSSPIIDIIYPVRMYNIVNGELKFIDEIPGNNHRN